MKTHRNFGLLIWVILFSAPWGLLTVVGFMFLGVSYLFSIPLDLWIYGHTLTWKEYLDWDYSEEKVNKDGW